MEHTVATEHGRKPGSSSTPGLRLLSLDGGGVRGLSSLMILQQLMVTIDPESPPKPCDCFDMIAGTSTGGLIAIMLGRLQMTVDECINAYASLSSKVFQQTSRRVKINGKLQGRFDSAKLEQAVKQIILDRGLNQDTLLKDSPKARCKVFVCTTSIHTGDIVCLTSYPSTRLGTHLFDSTKIWQACRATSAATTFFDPIVVGKYGEKFIDGALGANNPINILWNQAQDVWGDQLWGRLRCLVSIGTGLPALTPVRDDVLGIWSTLRDLATETERTAEQFRRDKSRLDDEGRYVRFNVDRGLEHIGLEESEKKAEIAAATGTYIASQAVVKQMKACAANLKERQYHGLYQLAPILQGEHTSNNSVDRPSGAADLDRHLNPIRDAVLEHGRYLRDIAETIRAQRTELATVLQALPRIAPSVGSYYSLRSLDCFGTWPQQPKSYRAAGYKLGLVLVIKQPNFDGIRFLTSYAHRDPQMILYRQKRCGIDVSSLVLQLPDIPEMILVERLVHQEFKEDRRVLTNCWCRHTHQEVFSIDRVVAVKVICAVVELVRSRQ